MVSWIPNVLQSAVVSDDQTTGNLEHCNHVIIFFTLCSLQGHLINAIAWNKSKLNESSTQTILLGTTKGVL